MSGIIIEPATSIDAIERNFARLNEAVVALQGGSIAIENIEGYENLATKLYVEEEVTTARYAVGDIHITEDETNPEDKFGYGTWEIISRGHVLAGIDVTPENDSDYEQDQDFQTPGQTGGEKKHTLTVEELPAHTHQQTHSSPDWDQGESARYNRNYSVGSNVQLDNMPGDDTAEAGGDEPHNNLQPYYCVYIWKRTA